VLRRPEPAAADRAAGDHRAVAGQRTFGPATGAGHRARPALHRQLVARTRPAHSGQNRPGRAQRARRLLRRVSWGRRS
jgi:hypothetical protein